MNFLKAYIHHSLQPAKRMSEFGSPSLSAPETGYQAQDRLFPVQEKGAEIQPPESLAADNVINQAEKVSVSGSATGFTDQPVMVDNASSTIQSPDNERPMSTTDTENNNPPPLEALPGDEDSDPGVEFRTVDKPIDQQSADNSTAQISIDKPPAQESYQQQAVAGMPEPDFDKPYIRANQQANETAQTDNNDTAIFTPNPGTMSTADTMFTPDTMSSQDTMHTRQLTTNNMGSVDEPSGKARQQQQQVVNEPPAAAVEHEPVETIISRQNKPLQGNLFATEAHAEEVPQVRIGHINVLIEDQSASKSRRSSTKATAVSSNTFGLRGL